jgi:alpha-glucosidase
VDALWLTPFYKSPMADFGYDVADYRQVDPVFGSIEDARELITDAHAHDLKIIVDVVPNHTSDQHAWFVEALAAEPGSLERARYIFRDGQGDLPPNDWESVFGGPAWTRVAVPNVPEAGTVPNVPEAGTDPDVPGAGKDGQWYLHLFASAQPDLNWDNPEVHAEFEDILRFWLDLGVDGFRIDVAHGMVKAAGLPDVGFTEQIQMLGTTVLPYFDQDGVHEIHRSWRRLLDSYPGERVAVAEAWAPTAERLARYVREDELHQAFNFQYLSADWDAAALRHVIEESLHAAEQVGAPTTWVLSNHDVKRHVTRYGDGDLGLRRARAAALLMLALPGSAYVYQGEELGLPEVLDLPEEFRTDPQRGRGEEAGRDGCRVPMPWSGEVPPFGFSTSGSWLPIPGRWRDLTVSAQSEDFISTLSLYKAALSFRHGHPALGDGALSWLEGPEGVLIFERVPAVESGRTPAEHFRCAINVSERPAQIRLDGEIVIASAPVQRIGRHLQLPQDAAVWWIFTNGQLNER